MTSQCAQWTSKTHTIKKTGILTIAILCRYNNRNKLPLTKSYFCRFEHAPGSFCTRGSVFKFAQFAPEACSITFNLLSIVEHFAWWEFCSRG